MNGYNRVAPVNEGDEIDVKIIAIGDKGDGIAKKDNFVLVVPGTQVDDEVRVRVTKVLRNVGFAEVVEGAAAEPKEEEEEPEEETEAAEEEEETPEAELEEDTEPPESEKIPEPVDSEDFGADLEEKK